MDLTPIEQRRFDAATQILGEQHDAIAFLHSILAQTSLPYRDPGDGVRDYVKANGKAKVIITAGAVADENDKTVVVGLPYASRPRLLLLHACTHAVRNKSPEVPIGNSMTSFMRDELQIPTTGPSIRRFKEQLNRLALATIKLQWTDDSAAKVINAPSLFSEIDVWFGSHPEQQMLWPSSVRLSDQFFASLQNHALPLDPRAIRALQHNPRALDTYTWLSVRLPRVKRLKGDFISWQALQGQFGGEVAKVENFKKTMKPILHMVHGVYPDARIEQVKGGIRIYQSPPPIKTVSIAAG